MKHRRLFREGIPVGLGDAIACFTTMDGGKIEGAMDVCIRMCKIQPPAKCTSLLRLAWAAEVSEGRIRWVDEEDVGVRTS